jgi:hypothetical protein
MACQAKNPIDRRKQSERNIERLGSETRDADDDIRRIERGAE